MHFIANILIFSLISTGFGSTTEPEVNNPDNILETKFGRHEGNNLYCGSPD